MKQKQRFISFLLAWLMVATFGYAIALPQLQDDKKKTHTSTAQPVQLDEDTIPDSLLHTRWQIQRTQPYSLSDLYQSPLDLQRPDNMKYDVVYNDTLNRFVIGNRMGNTWLSAPIMLTPEEYNSWTEMNERSAFFRKKNDDRLLTIFIDSVAQASVELEMESEHGVTGYNTAKSIILSKAMRKITN